MLRRTLLSTLSMLLLYAEAGQAAQSRPSYNLDKVWPNTHVYIADQKPFLVKDAAAFERAASKFPKPSPAIIFLHGCGGYKMDYWEVAYPPAFAKAGFVVFVPDSYARGPKRQSACGRVLIDTVQLRRAEVTDALKHISSLSWIDQRNIFLAGHSEGGIATAMYDGGNFRGYFLSGWTCTSDNPEFDRIHAARNKPFLAVVGSEDEFHRGKWHRGKDCGMRMKGRPNARSVVLKGVDHYVMRDPRTIPMAIEFFNDNLAK